MLFQCSYTISGIYYIHSEKFFLLQIKITLLRKQPNLDLSRKFKAFKNVEYTLFLYKTSKFCLRLTILIFFHFGA